MAFGSEKKGRDALPAPLLELSTAFADAVTNATAISQLRLVEQTGFGGASLYFLGTNPGDRAT